MQLNALQVYLDSSDFSNLADPRRTSPALREIEEQLLAWQKTGQIELRFSGAHVIEAAPISFEHLENGRARLACIARLCGKKTLLAPSTLMEHEIRRYFSDAPLTSNREIFLDNGRWIPDFEDDGNYLRFDKAGVLKAIEEEKLGRKEKRKKLREIFDNSGALRPAARQAFKADSESFISAVQEKYPLNEKAIQAFTNSFFGDGSPANISEGLKESISDLENFSNWLERHWESLATTTSWLRASGEQVKLSFEQTIMKVQELLSNSLASGLSKERTEAIMRTTFEDMRDNLFKNVAKRLGTHLELEKSGSEIHSPVNAAPGIFTAVEVMGAVSRESMLNTNAPRSPKVSDLGDILHCLYLPYVDIYRADAFMANAIAKASLTAPTVVVGRLVELPNAIEGMLKTRKEKRSVEGSN